MKYKKFLIPSLFIVIILSFGLYLYFNNSSKKPAEISNKSSINENDKLTKNSAAGPESNTQQGSTSGGESTKVNSSGEASAAKDITLINTAFNSEGNTPGNLMNGGLFASQGNWMFYSQYAIVKYSINLCRSMLDGEVAMKPYVYLPGSITNINVVGEWIYFISVDRNNSIYKMRTDGRDMTQLTSGGSLFLNVIDDWIYYIDSDNGLQGIYKIKTDGTSKSNVTKDRAALFNISNGWIYYLSMDKGPEFAPLGIFKVKLDGTSKTKVINESPMQFIVSGEWLYYIDTIQKTLNKIKTDGSGKRTLMHFQDFLTFNMSGEWIYFIKSEDPANIYKIGIDGTKVSKITDNPPALDHPYASDLNKEQANAIYSINSLHIIGDSIFAHAYTGTHPVIYRVKLDGTLSKTLN